jgi:hypothetical protein
LAIGGAAAVAQLTSFVNETIRLGDSLDKTAQQVGLTTQELQAFSHAAELGGVDSAAFANGMGQLQRKAYDASTGLQEAEDSFAALGIEVLDSSGELKTGSQLLNEVADGLQNTENSTTRTALSMELMGRSGRRLLPMLTSGSEGLAQMAGELDELGGGASDQMIQQSVALTDNLTRFRVRLLSIRSALATRFLPVIDRTVRWLGGFSEKVVDLIENSHLLKAAAIAVGAVLVAIGVATAASWAPIVGVVAAVSVGITVLTLLIDDLWMTAQDPAADTLTRRFLEWATGAENARQIINNLNQAVEDLRNTLSSVAGFIGIEVGEEGTDRQRANVEGREAREGITGSEWFQTAAQILTPGMQQHQTAPQLSAEDQAELSTITGQRRTQTLIRENRERQSTEYIERLIGPTSAPLEPGRQSIPREVRAAPAQTQQISIDAPMSVDVSIAEATDAAVVDRIVRRGIREERDRGNRELLAGLARPAEATE